MSNLTEHAKYELERVGMFDSDADYNGALGHAVMRLIDVFDEQGYSGYSAVATIQLFTELASFRPLSPLTSDPSEWVEVTDGLWQNTRRSSTFSEDGGQTWYDIEDAKTASDVVD